MSQFVLIKYENKVYTLNFSEIQKATYQVLGNDYLLCRKAERIANRLMKSGTTTELYWFRLAVSFSILGDILERELNERIALIPDYYLNELTTILNN
ncbi:MAG: hypothetical protein K0B10_07265 [Vicingaceae bacterium]|nr:hypothetical protein [Vicingaceae bacterium]